MPLDQLPGVPGGSYEAKIQHWRGFQTFCRSDYFREEVVQQAQEQYVSR